jgi:hypothetical protein
MTIVCKVIQHVIFICHISFNLCSIFNSLFKNENTLKNYIYSKQVKWLTTAANSYKNSVILETSYSTSLKFSVIAF